MARRYAQSNRAAGRQLAILFSFLEKDQPVRHITELLAQTENATVTAFRVTAR
jgi:hypothetical protein